MKIIIQIFLAFAIQTITSKILFVFEQCRHGAQSTYLNKTSSYVDQYGQGIGSGSGSGELTGVGMRMHYLIGVRSREKYKGLFKNQYDPREIYVVSTDTNRTISSAQSQLLGMFPPQSGIELTEDEVKRSFPPIPLTAEMLQEIQKLNMSVLPQKMQIVPIHFFHQNERTYMLTEPEECPKMKFVRQENQKKKPVVNFLTSFNKNYGTKLLKILNQTNKDYLLDYKNLLNFTEHYMSEYVNGRNLTLFAETGINVTELYKQCKQFKMLTLFSVDSTSEIGVMAMSPTITKIINWMDKSIENSMHFQSMTHYLFPKFVMYSGHDFTIAPMEQYMQKAFDTDLHYPVFASNQFFELHEIEYGENTNVKKKIEDYYVEYYFNDYLLLNVSYVIFKQRVQEIAWSTDDINNFCNVINIFTIDYIMYAVLGFSVLSLLIIMTKQIVCSAIKKNPKGRHLRKGSGDDIIEENDNEYGKQDQLVIN